MADPNSSTAKSSVFLLDDHPLVLFSIHSLLSQGDRYHVNGSATNLAAAQKSLFEQSTELLICEAAVSDGDTVGLIQWLVGHAPKTKVLVYSVLDEQQTERFQRAGASAYVNKSSPLAMLLEAIETVLAERNYRWDASKDPLNRKPIEMVSNTRGILDLLTERELEIFQLTGNGLTSREIAEKLGISRKTVEAHRQNIRQSLKLKNMRELVRLAAICRTNLEPDQK